MIRRFFPYLFLSALSVLTYLAVSQAVYRIGFPLDDAWIHQTYARNLGRFGEWAYLPGQPSAGSTAPLWTALLAIGHALRLGPYLWAYFLGWISLASLAGLGIVAMRSLQPAHPGWAGWAAGLLVLEWHLVWASVSGMETLLLALLALLVMTWLVAGWGRPILLGLVIGLSVWVRPDGLTLLAPAMLVLGLEPFLRIFSLLVRSKRWSEVRIEPGESRPVLLLILGFVLLFVPYLLFNYILAGDPWPNTFYAKQAEYAITLQQPLGSRLSRLGLLPLVGAGALLAPGFFVTLLTAVRKRRWAVLAGSLWSLGYILLYAVRLPVIYQHGRYLIPMMPVFFIWCLAGHAEWIRLDASQFAGRVVSRAWVAATGAVLLLFWALGAVQYARDVAFIESEMVETAHWVARNVASSDLIAAHDIGALGYFGERRLLDLAGLISPEVIPYIRDEERLAAYISLREAQYLVTFPGWYHSLDDKGLLVFTTHGKYGPQQGGENMAVFRWKSLLGE